MARTKNVQRSISVTRALAEQPEAKEPAETARTKKTTKTPVTNLPATENVSLVEKMMAPASESPVKQEMNDDELSATRVETTAGTQTTSAATTITTSVMTPTITQPTLLIAAGSMASRARSQASAGTSDQPAAHASTQQATVTTGTTATLLSALQRIMTTVNRLETRMNDVEPAQAPTQERQPMAPVAPQSTLPMSTTTRSPETAEAGATEAVTPTLTNLAVDVPTQNVVTDLELQLVALLTTINTANLTAATVAKPRTAARARRTVPPGPGDGDDGGGVSSDDSDYSRRSDDSDSSSDDDHRRRRRQQRKRGRRDLCDRRRHRHRMKKNVKELDLQPFKPQVGGIRIETWIAKMDLAVQGARISGRGGWSEKELYYVRRRQTGAKLKDALLRRYGERLDLAQAECRVMQRTMMPGETFADLAAGLHKTTRQLVKLEPAPTTLVEAVDKAMKIDDSSYNVALGMINNNQAWVMNAAQTADDEDMEGESRVYFTNPQGIFDKNTNVWVAPGGRTWNRMYWRLNKKSRGRQRRTAAQDQRAMNTRYSARPDKKVKALMVKADEDASSNEESKVPSSPPQKKNRNARVRQTKAPDKPLGSKPPNSERPGGRRQCEEKCFACGNLVTSLGTALTPQRSPGTRLISQNARLGKRQSGEVGGRLHPAPPQDPRETATNTTDAMVTSDGDDRYRATPAETLQELLVVGGTRVKTTAGSPMDAAVARELAETCTDPHSDVNGEAKRYVETVRPAMKALRYPGADGRDGERRERLHAAEEGGVLTFEEDDVLMSEEGGARTSEYGGVPVTEEGGMKKMEKNNKALETVANTLLTIAPVVKTATEFMPLTTTVPVMTTPS
ncbi:hypothetical protein PPTG_23323 [Phytophthora nicotianae INRA-310]|uniref:Uncharacterized protein n=1 Tax=Phytophthora nicotianae (strain INRA-310) TaxID=761204 RepID=W2Q0I2_PHYN3|nr:hypothetical protein PPTG_23323 [Phytophthora nicotianae INRA-310]ETN06627.1 hypothetical protein PPTG_23323 [Phytophthora nicotianae INRA-310]